MHHILHKSFISHCNFHTVGFNPYELIDSYVKSDTSMAAIERNWKRISEHEIIFFPLAHGSSENRI